MIKNFIKHLISKKPYKLNDLYVGEIILLTHTTNNSNRVDVFESVKKFAVLERIDEEKFRHIKSGKLLRKLSKNSIVDSYVVGNIKKFNEFYSLYIKKNEYYLTTKVSLDEINKIESYINKKLSLNLSDINTLLQ